MENTPKKKKHLVRNILLSILLVLVLIIGCVLIIFGDEIRILYKAMNTTPEAIESQRIENDKKTQDLLEEIAVATMRDLTDEERKLLASGDLSPEDALALIKGETASTTADVADSTENDPALATDPLTTADTVSAFETTSVPDSKTDTNEPQSTTKATTKITVTEKNGKPISSGNTPSPSVSVAIKPQTTTSSKTPAAKPQTTKKPSSNGTPEQDTAKRNRIDEIIAEIYLLRATYLNKIDQLIKDAKATYIALPKNQHNLQGKMRVVERYLIPKGNALEAECDAKMRTLLAELKGLLNDLGMSTEIINEIQKTYNEQKEIKKTELYNQYSSKLN